jgi:hypothetical protein
VVCMSDSGLHECSAAYGCVPHVHCAPIQVDPSWPVLEDPSSHAYIRPEGGGLMVGLFEPDAAAWNVGAIPDDSSYTQV